MKKESLIKLLPIIVAVSLALGIFTGNFFARRQNTIYNKTETIYPTESKTAKLLNLIKKQYVDTVNIAQIEEKTLPEIIRQLDPHSSYIPAKDIEEVNSDLSSSFSGIGVQFNLQSDTIYIVDIIRGGPSEHAGLMAGDRIIEVNDTIFVGKDINNEKVMKKLRGPKGTKVKLGIKRRNTAEILHFTITRNDIPIHSVEAAFIISPNVGYIFVSKFGANTYMEFLTAIAKLKKMGATQFIIDLRGNSGGYLDAAINMINEFLTQGQLIVYTEGHNYKRSEAYANGAGSCKSDRMTVLIDEFSGSASEIFAGAIQDNDRGLIIGRRSFGKGLVQQQIPFEDKSAVRLTVARYYTPSGRCIQKPYKMGNTDDYEKDILNRYEHGEFYSQDSIQQTDTIAYKTLNGRIVYGGGGIMPDIFVPSDTSDITPYFNKIFNKAIIYKFALRYADEHREELKKLPDYKAMKDYLEKRDLFEQFTSYAKKQDIEGSKHDMLKSQKRIKNQLYAYITRNILGDEDFYKILNQTDNCVQTAIKAITNEKEYKKLLHSN